MSSKRRLLPAELVGEPKFRQIALACPICKYPLGSGGKRVTIGPRLFRRQGPEPRFTNEIARRRFRAAFGAGARHISSQFSHMAELQANASTQRGLNAGAPRRRDQPQNSRFPRRHGVAALKYPTTRSRCSGSGFATPRTRGEPLPEAMALATATRDGRPSVRDRAESRRQPRRLRLLHQLQQPQSCRPCSAIRARPLCFTGRCSSGKLRVEGRVRQTDAPRIGTIFSDAPARKPAQRMGVSAERGDSGTIVSRGGIRARAGALRRRQNIPCPPFWGGFRIVANCIEFWQGQPASPARSPCFIDEKETPGRFSGSHPRRNVASPMIG